MIATALEITADRATVEPRPCWLARLFGARTVRVELEYRGGGWHTVNTRNRLHDCNGRDRRILNALDFRPVARLPEATVQAARRRP